ncbi:fuconate dehydratase [Actinocrinis puniceicyclus]|uniref:L-fuconate dehydratase n=1 Tax=Actinocrinis puniceicyclus TaxID=977794 RepID=A0A8J7WQB7_9ACTN|nr:enolase C-terminal domain-like protein [Actinocrinis puniceicyclus]MBS2966581.1 fuconate dehydratase [Actinocrinis puniceicyclus]
MSAAPEVIVAVEVADIRFPTSLQLDGSDAMNPEPDYSATYVTVRTSGGAAGYGLAFTVGRGNDVQVAAVRALAPLVVGLPVADVLGDLGGFSRRLTGDSQLRWLGPEKGAIHMAAGAIVNAVWDLYGRREGKPVWRLLSELTPDQLVDLVDFRYLQDALTRAEALAILRRAEAGRAERTALLLERGYPAYTTTPGWLGYSDDKLVRLAKEAVADGFPLIKLKVGADLGGDVRRMRLAREAVGEHVHIAVDANQAWGVDQAIDWMTQLAPYRPYWIEEPTSPDDILGHAAIRRAIAPIKVATGEHVHNQVMFKQLLQAGALDVLQLDASRTAGVTENIAILLLAAKFDVPVCPHAGGVGLCEMVQHLAMFDYVAVSGTMQNRIIEYVDHLHEHFTDPVHVRGGRYLAPAAAGISARIHPSSVAEHRFPDGPVWSVDGDGVSGPHPLAGAPGLSTARTAQ